MRKKLTEEEKKAKKRAYYQANKDKAKARYEANREAILINQKAYCEANKETIAISKKAYSKANKESIAIYQKAHYQANRESLLINQRAYNEANKDERKAYKESKRLHHHIVYCLPNYKKHGYIKYAGVTNIPYNRMIQHKSEGKNTDEWFVLHECDTREEAEKIEAEYHEKGYAGKRGYKNK